MPRLLADENMSGLGPLFAGLGELRTKPGRAIGPADLAGVDALLIRSVTRVDAGLIAESPLSFVGSATIGVDHVDQPALAARGIAFASAPGCNADAVGDYVLSAIAAWCQQQGRDDWRQLKVGVIGRGHVGGSLQRRLSALGVEVRACDPPLAARGVAGLVDLEAVLASDVISLHVPLTRSGQWPSAGLIGADELATLAQGQLLINTSRGGVVDESALKQRLDQPRPPAVVIDTWENEPLPDSELVNRVWLATPHIAGYSREGRLRGSWMIATALAKHLGRPVPVDLEQVLPPRLRRKAKPKNLVECILAGYDVRHDDAAFRRLAGDAAEASGAGFDRLRRDYPMRAEFSRIRFADLPAGAQAAGFSLA